jgi:hypothetical protein
LNQPCGLPKHPGKKIATPVLLISGSAGNQISMDGEQSGAFTGMLKKVWNRGEFRGPRPSRQDPLLLPPTRQAKF